MLCRLKNVPVEAYIWEDYMWWIAYNTHAIAVVKMIKNADNYASFSSATESVITASKQFKN